MRRRTAFVEAAANSSIVLLGLLPATGSNVVTVEDGGVVPSIEMRPERRP
jgi:hypothetical protein